MERDSVCPVFLMGKHAINGSICPVFLTEVASRSEPDAC